MRLPESYSTLKEKIIFLAGVFLLVLLIISGLLVVENSENQRFIEHQRQSILEQLATIRAKLEGTINTELILARSIIIEVETNTDISKDRFFDIAQHFMDASKHIKNIGLAKGTILTYVYPEEGNKAAIGLNYKKNKLQWPAVRRVIEGEKTVVAGPLKLVQGGVGIIGRTPVFVSKNGENPDSKGYFGILSVVMNLPGILQASGIDNNDSLLKVALKGKDSLGDKGDVFYGPERIFTENPVLMKIALPGGGQWLMAAIPLNGWEIRSPHLYLHRIIAATIMLIFVFLLYLQKNEMKNRKIAQATLRESEERFRRLTENAKDMIYRMSLPDGRYEYVSPASVDLFGYSPEEFYKTPSLIGRIIHPHWTDYFNKQWAKLVEGDMPRFYEYQIVHKSGEERWMNQRNVLICDEDGKPAAIEGIVTDITHRKEAEQKLKKSEQELQIVLATSPVGLGLVIDRKLDWGNRSMYQMFGYGQDTLSGASSKVLYPDEKEFKRVGSLLYSGISEHGTGQTEARCIRKDGTLFDCFIQMTSVDKSHPSKGQIVSIVDFSAQKRAEKEREILQAQLAQAQKMESIGRLAGGVAHDFNNMLSVILGNAEILAEDMDPSHPSLQNFTEIRKAAERSADLTRQLLAFARKQTIIPKVIDLNKTIEGMLKMLQRLIGEDINLSWHPKADLWPVKIDSSQIDQILANLCVNARHSIKGVGGIIIETDHVRFDEAYCSEHAGFIPGNYVLLAVSDTGSGMDQTTLDNLFEPFFTTKGTGEGTGLGLATVYGIVKQNNGFINVYSELGQGSVFKIYLPKHLKKAFEESNEPAEQLDYSGTETILLVEDEEAILNMTAMILKRMGHKVLKASTPSEAINLARCYTENDIHLLMTDVVMPEMNGKKLVKKIIEIYPNIKCLFMSGYTANVIAHHGILYEGLNFLGKPFSKQDLIVKLREIFDRK